MREIKLDQSKLYGFKILPKTASLQGEAFAAELTAKAECNPVVKLGAKVGGKPGLKPVNARIGAKIGGKIGLKPVG